MSRNNILFLVVGALCVVVAGLGYQVYQDHHKTQRQGLNINVGPSGLHVNTK